MNKLKQRSKLRRSSLALAGTDEMKAEELHARLAAIVDSSSDAIISKTLDSVVTSWNRAAERLFGYVATEMIGQSVLRLFPPGRREKERKVLARLKKSRRIEHYETEFVTKTGARIPVDVSRSPIKDASGKIIGASVIVHDITERKRIEERIQKLNEELEAKVASRTGDLARTVEELKTATVARKELAVEVARVSEREQQRLGRELHDDIAQELTGASYTLQMLEEKVRTGTSITVGELERLVTMLSGSVEKTRALAKGLYPADLERYGLVSGLKQLAQSTRQLYRLRCQLHIGPKLPAFSKEVAIQLYRVAQEAVHNAAKHAQAKKIAIKMARRNTHVVLTVKDDGQGLPKNFDLGQGMGQKIMHSRAETIGATLDVRNHRKGGVLVTCTLLAPVRE